MPESYKVTNRNFETDGDWLLIGVFVLCIIVLPLLFVNPRKSDSSLSKHESVEVIKMAEYIRDNGSESDKQQLVEIVNRAEKAGYLSYSDKRMIEVVYSLSKKYAESEASSTENKNLVKSLIGIQGSN